jgi:hypothetical protein
MSPAYNHFFDDGCSSPNSYSSDLESDSAEDPSSSQTSSTSDHDGSNPLFGGKGSTLSLAEVLYDGEDSSSQSDDGRHSLKHSLKRSATKRWQISSTGNAKRNVSKTSGSSSINYHDAVEDTSLTKRTGFPH